MIPFNKPYFTGNETKYIKEAVDSGKISGNGVFTKRCHDFFMNRYGFKKVLLTSSGTDALEMAAILANIKEGDEIIMPSYTFVSTANAFVLRGAKIVFVDSNLQNPNIDCEKIERLITEKTKAIVPVHYAGIACDMDKIKSLAAKYQLLIIEDAAQAIDARYKNQWLGTIGDMAAFSFHETKNIISGEGGMLAVNNEKFMQRAEIIWEKGTNRAAFFRGEINKYGWVDIGSSFLPSEITAAFLYAQLEKINDIQKKRILLWNTYYKNLHSLSETGIIKLPEIPEYAENNGHLFYIICKDFRTRSLLIEHLKANNILSVFHYLPLHSSPFFSTKHDERILKMADLYSDCLLRLPLYFELTLDDVNYISEKIKGFFKDHN